MARRIFEILASEPEPGLLSPDQFPPHWGGLGWGKAVRGQVRFVEVDFRYTNGENAEGPAVLQAIDLEAQLGEIIALVGYSGGGKTTLVNLIPRFYAPPTVTLKLTVRTFAKCR